MFRVLAIFLCTALLLSGCQKKLLYSDLDQRQANEMVAALGSHDIEAAKSQNNSDSWDIMVAQEDFSRALDVLRKEGLPGERFSNLGQIFEKKGMISSPTEERARYTYAKSQELSETISTIHGVVSARVHIALSKEDVLAGTLTPASASVLIIHKPTVDLSTHIVDIKSLLVNSIESLKYEHVSVVLFPTAEESISEPVAAEASMGGGGNSLRNIILTILTVLVILFIVGRTRQNSRRLPSRYRR